MNLGGERTIFGIMQWVTKSNEFHREVRPKVTELLSPNPGLHFWILQCGKMEIILRILHKEALRLSL